MRKKKQPREYAAVTRRAFRPEMTVCLTCHTPLRRYATLSQRTVITLDGPVRVIHRGYRCPNAACATRLRSYRSAAADATSAPWVHLWSRSHDSGGTSAALPASDPR